MYFSKFGHHFVVDRGWVFSLQVKRWFKLNNFNCYFVQWWFWDQSDREYKMGVDFDDFGDFGDLVDFVW